ncbi:MAG: hypothetical protein II171_07860 [Bacteroidales bacterium]|nr:hypothetical protein [Bacteroidales bacterium]
MCSDGRRFAVFSRRFCRWAGALLGWVLLSINAESCSVKENRSLCPCLLTVRISAVRSPPATLVCISGPVVTNRIVPGDTLFHIPVPRGRVLALAYAGAEEIPHPEEGCTAPLGHTFPPLYLASALVEAAGDSTSVHLPLRKQFCTLSLTLEGPPGWADPYAMEVAGEVCGVSASGAPLPGPFRAPFLPATASVSLSARMLSTAFKAIAGADGPVSGVWSVRLPRQHPSDPLWLDILMPDRVVRRFNLGALLKDAGYDWLAPDLEDLELSLELSVTAITFRSGLWSTTLPLTLTI